jgi:hypothetical protein
MPWRICCATGGLEFVRNHARTGSKYRSHACMHLAQGRFDPELF